MPKSDHKYLNQSQDHELNYHLRKNGFRQTQENRDILKNITPNNTRLSDLNSIILKAKKRLEKS